MGSMGCIRLMGVSKNNNLIVSQIPLECCEMVIQSLNLHHLGFSYFKASLSLLYA